MSIAEMNAALGRLYVDAHMRRLFANEPESILGAYRLSDAEATAIAGIDRERLERFADALLRKKLGRMAKTYEATRVLGPDRFDEYFRRFYGTRTSYPGQQPGEYTIEKVDRLQSRLGKQVVLENVTYDFTIPGADLTQEEFFGELVGATGCGMLLDVTNLYTNSVNHGFDPLEALDRLPLDSVVQVHLAGGYWDDGVLLDGHCATVPEEVWALFGQVVQKTPVRAALLEHDSHFPPIEQLLRQVSRARELLHR